MEEFFQTAVLTHPSSVSIQWDFPAVWSRRKIFLSYRDQLKSFAQLRTNLSPFTKDFHVWETPIENSNYFSSFPWGSIYLRLKDLTDRQHICTCSGETSLNLSKCICPSKYWQYCPSRAQKQKWETLLKMLKPTAPSVPRRSPIQVLTRLNVA